MVQPFPYANIVAGVLVLVVGFGFHWIGQLLSLLNWDLATRIGIQEEGLLPEYRVYEHAIAVADVVMGWIYGFAGIGLVLGTAGPMAQILEHGHQYDRDNHPQNDVFC